MRIEHRDPNLKYPRDIHDQKRRIVLDWLLEFRFSSFDLLAYRLGSTYRKSYDFFRSLLAKQLIQEVKTVATNYVRLVMLTKAGVDMLQVAGRDVSKAYTQGYKLNRYSQIMHDSAVQTVLLKRLHKCDEVIWDKNIVIPDQFEKPDALVHSLDGYWLAFEYERWRKADKRIYLSFMTHTQALINRHYQGVYYFFDQKPDSLHYSKLFAAEEWPQYRYYRQTGKILLTAKRFKPDSTKNLRKAFRFLHEPHLQKLAPP